MKLMKAHKIDLDPISKRTINPEYNVKISQFKTNSNQF